MTSIENSGRNAEDEQDFPPGHPVHAAVHRMLSNHYSFWCICNASPCRRARRCTGDPARCLEACMPLLPADAYEGGMRALDGTSAGLTFEQALARWPDELAAWTEWKDRLEASRGRPRRAGRKR